MGGRLESGLSGRLLLSLGLGLAIAALWASPGASRWPAGERLIEPAVLNPLTLQSTGNELTGNAMLPGIGEMQSAAILMVESRTVRVGANLFDALDQAGIPDAILAQVVDLFSPEVDFNALDAADRLTVQWQARLGRDDLQSRPQKLLAAQLQRGQLGLDAIWFERADGQGDFHALDGRPLSRTFLMSPIAYDRVSSGYVDRREHPLRPGHWQAHQGIDLPAPIGTPVRATADGILEFSGMRGGYGLMVRILHNERQSTLYAHLNEIAPGLERGRRINQSEVIGTVGQTGDATGPHLHFEFIQDGRTIDPSQALDERPLQALGPQDRRALYASAERMRRVFLTLQALQPASFE